MRGVKLFFLAMVALAGLIMGGCGGDNENYVIVYGGKFLYVNNDAATNAVSAFRIMANGTLEEIAGSPFATGGAGSSGGFYAANKIAIARHKRLLFASNANDNTISVFTINATTGELTAVGVPVANSSAAGMGNSGSLAVDDAENFLFVGNDNDDTVSVFSIAADGALTPVAGSPFDIGAFGVDGITLNAKGNGLYIAAPDVNEIVVMTVAADGTLTPIAGSPFAYTGVGTVYSFVLATSTIGLSGASDGVNGGTISSYSIDATGAPTLLDSLSIGAGGNSQAVSTARRGTLAFLSGGDSFTGTNQISVLHVASDGTLTPVVGSPFTTDSPTSGYAIANFTGRYVYVTEEDQIEAFRIDLAGGLTSIDVDVLTNPGIATSAVIY